MKKKIAILGSTGSIGQNTLKIIKLNKKNFKVNLLSTNKNINKILNQAKEFKVNNIIITDLHFYKKAKIQYKNKNINIYNNFDELSKILKLKNDFIMSSISGLNGLLPTLKSIKHTKKILIANKEAIICAWNLIYKELKKYNTDFIPVDSEHFSIWKLLQNNKSNIIEKIYITASGGPFLRLPKKEFSNISVKNALNHPNWKMGKKISIDSATLMNKVFEVIEAKNIFGLNYNDISILTHPKSYIHAITKFKSGLTQILLHDPDMKIPIYNSIYSSNLKPLKRSSLKFDILNNLELNMIDEKKFPLIQLIKKLPKHLSLFETILVTINDYLVLRFLEKKINFNDLIKLIFKVSNFKEFQKFKKIKPNSLDEILALSHYVSLKLDKICI
jgi:1-deoxy-D-xylulose-5-phosphate reductoisomerase